MIAADESTILSKSFFDPVVVEDSENNRSFPDPPCPDESDGFEVSGELDDYLNQLISPEKVPRHGGRQFTTRDAMETSGCRPHRIRYR